MMLEHCLVVNYNEEEFVAEVNNQIADGWKPQGGVAICARKEPPMDRYDSGDHGDYIVYSQAMTRGE